MNPLHHPDQPRCKKLTEIGFPETDLFYSRGANKARVEYYINRKEYGNKEDRFLCPSVMEMLDVIPNDLGTGKLNDVLKIQNSFNDWSVSMGKSFHTEGTLPNSVADLILWLVENGYLKF